MTSKKHIFYIFAKINNMKKTIVNNLSWVLVCSIFAKLLGGVYRIILTRILGTDIGLYQMVFSAYSFLVILISSGLPMAISKMVSGSRDNVKQKKLVSGTGAILMLISGSIAVVLLLGSKGLALLQGNGKIYICYIILAPSLIFSAGAAVLKGYEQGVNNFRLPALAGIVEQVFKVAFGLLLMLVLRRWYLLGALLGAMLGSLIGDISAYVFLKWFSKNKVKFKYSYESINDGKSVFVHSYPIMLYSLIVPFSNFVDSFLVVKLIGISLPTETATLLYGLQTGVVGSILSIPGIFSFSMASVLMPSLSSDYANGNYNRFDKKVGLAFKLVIFIALPCAIFFAVNASNIINLLYGAGINGFGVNGQYVAKNLLIISSISIIFSSINQLSAVILQNLDKKFLPIINLCIGIICKLAIELMFVPSGKIGIYAYSIAVAVGFVVAGVLNLYSVEKYSNNTFSLNYLIKQFGLGVVVLGLLTIFKLFNSITIFILGGIFTGIIYLIAIYVLKIFTKKDFNLFINSE